MNPELSDKIDAYLNGTLQGEALKTFEKQLATDAALADEVHVFRLEKQGVEVLIQEDLKLKMNDWKTKMRPDVDAEIDEIINGGKSYQDMIKFNNRFLLTLVFLVLFAYSLVYFAFKYMVHNKDNKTQNPPQEMPQKQEEKQVEKQVPIVENNNKPSNEINVPTQKQDPENTEMPSKNRMDYTALANAIYAKPDFTTDVLKSDNNSNDPIEPFVKYWKSNDYEKIISLAQSVGKKNPVYVRVQELLGHAYFKKQNFNDAEKIFAHLAQTDTGDIGEEAAWFQSLSLLALKNKDAALLILKQIVKDKTHRKNEQAARLLALLSDANL